MRRIAALTFAILLAVPLTFMLSTAPTSAGEIDELTGVPACQPDGSVTVTWTFTNILDVPVEITSAIIEGTATGITFSPLTVPAGGTSVGTTNVAGSVPGQIEAHLTISGQGPDDTGTFFTTIGLPGDCVATVTTVSIATTTTAVQAAAVAQPHFTG